MDGALRILRLTGGQLQEKLADLARLRIQVFREWPYLYEGDPAYERRYLDTYAKTEGAVIVAALDGERVVGAATALPMAGEPENVKAPFLKLGYDIGRLFYFGESVLLPAYRRRGIGVAFFKEREAHARSLGRFRHAVFCAVVRADADPRRPQNAVPLDSFWKKRGYQQLKGATCVFTWREAGLPEETAKTMQFWIKDLSQH
jgi:GNAT superfamily N-acetyltransferase